MAEVVAAGTELNAYAAEIADCTRCRLAEGRTQVVFGVGNPEADLMFVGEAPGFHEDKQGSRSSARRGSSSTSCWAESTCPARTCTSRT